jgi:hypothetical protein
MNIPTDTPPPSPPPSLPLGNLTEEAPPVTADQRAADFTKAFIWKTKELIFSVFSEMYYRTLRMHMNAPPLGSYQTLGDFTAEAPRVLYCASLKAKDIRALQVFPVEIQIEQFEDWVEKNILFHELIRAAELAKEINAAIARARTQPLENGEDEIDGMGN